MSEEGILSLLPDYHDKTVFFSNGERKRPGDGGCNFKKKIACRFPHDVSNNNVSKLLGQRLCQIAQ